MNISEIFIRRPVLSIVLSLLILLVGLQGALSLSVRQYPKVDETVITVNTAYPGAAASLIQGFITTPVAKAVSSAEGVDYVSSSSTQSASTVSVHMRLGADPDKALSEVIAKVQTVRQILPQEAEDPVIVKGTGWSLPLIFFAFTSDRMSPQQISEYLQRVVQPRISTVPGVAEARIIGAPDFAMRIWLDPIKLAAHDVTAAEVADAIRASNYLAAPGKIQGEYYAYAVETDTTLRTPEAFGAMPLRGSGDNVVRLRDVAKIELGAQNYDQRIMMEGRAGVFLGVFQTPSANPLELSTNLHKLFPTIQDSLPPSLTGTINYDFTVPIRASIIEVFKTMAEAVVIVILVILLFLGSIRTVLIPTVTIPLSLVGVCFVLLALGYSFNLLTLLAMVLAIGLVVDDAIVVVENVHRHIELGQTPLDAAISGMKEIIGPLVAMTITLAAVYAPIGFVQGLTGALFREFAFALAGAVIISGIIAATLSPMMSSRILKHESHAKAGWQDRLALWVERHFTILADHYRILLEQILGQRALVVGVCALIMVTTAVLFTHTQKVLAPAEDEGFIMSLIQGPRYATADYTANVLKHFDAAVGEMPETKLRFSFVGAFGPPSTGFGNFVLKPWGDRDRGAADIAKHIQAASAKVPGAQIAVFTPSSLPGTGNGLPIQLVVRGVGSSDQVFEVADEITKRAMATGRFFIVQNSASDDLPQAMVEIDRARAAALGVPVSEIGNTLGVLLSEGWVTRFDRESRSYQVIPQVPAADRIDPEKMGDFYVRAESGTLVPLSAVVKINTHAGPQSIEQFNQLNAATLAALPRPGMTVEEGLDVLRNVAREVMPDGFFLDVTGQGRLSAQEGSSLLRSFVFALIVIYLVLAAQFESFRDPLIIMTAVPLSIFGAMVPLNLGGVLQAPAASLNIYSQLGLITLIGLITKHGILIVQFANDRRAAGIPLREAVVEAAHVRLRPILMTTAAMVMGVLPLLVASGAGAEARKSMGLVIAAGMSVGTVFTLFVVPVFYTYIARRDPARPNVSIQTVRVRSAFEEETEDAPEDGPLPPEKARWRAS